MGKASLIHFMTIPEEFSCLFIWIGFWIFTAHSNVVLQLVFRWVDCCKSFSLHVQIQSTQSSINVLSFHAYDFSHRFLCFHCQPVNHVLNRVRQHTRSCTIIVSYLTGVTVACGGACFWQVFCVLEVVVMGKIVIMIVKKKASFMLPKLYIPELLCVQFHKNKE